MIYAAKIVFLAMTALWIAVAVTLGWFHGDVKSSAVVLGVLAIATGCVGTVTTWKFFRPIKRVEHLGDFRVGGLLK